MRAILAGMLLMLTACASLIDMENNFAVTEPTAPPEALLGTWTGSMGPYLTTIRVEPDGSGIYCYSWHDKNVIGRLKYTGEVVEFQDGGSVSILGVSDELSLQSSDGDHQYRFRRDPERGHASPYCATALARKE